MKPTQILQKLCKDNKLEAPHYFQDHVVIGKYCMTFTDEEVFTWNGPATCKNRDEHLALGVLHRWQEIPKVGCKVSRGWKWIIATENVFNNSFKINPEKMECFDEAHIFPKNFL